MVHRVYLIHNYYKVILFQSNIMKTSLNNKYIDKAMPVLFGWSKKLFCKIYAHPYYIAQSFAAVFVYKSIVFCSVVINRCRSTAFNTILLMLQTIAHHHHVLLTLRWCNYILSAVTIQYFSMSPLAVRYFSSYYDKFPY